MNTFVDETCRHWIERHQLAALPTVEVGSLDVNGSLRQYFTGPYWGIDLGPGAGVDQVVAPGWTAQDVWDGAGPGSAVAAAHGLGVGCVVWTEAAEHDPDPFHTARQIADLLWPGGILLATACGYVADGRCAAFHAYPFDLWRFSPTGWRHIIERAGLRVLAEQADDGRDFTVAAFARKDET